MNPWNIVELRSMIKGCQYKLSDPNLSDKEFETWFKYMRELVTNYNGLIRLKEQVLLNLGI